MKDRTATDANVEIGGNVLETMAIVEGTKNSKKEMTVTKKMIMTIANAISLLLQRVYPTKNQNTWPAHFSRGTNQVLGMADGNYVPMAHGKIIIESGQCISVMRREEKKEILTNYFSREHVYRKHILPTNHCDRCFEDLKDAQTLLQHHSQLQCEQTALLYATADRISQLKMPMKRGIEECEKWQNMYRILFPRDTHIPSPCVCYYLPGSSWFAN